MNILTYLQSRNIIPKKVAGTHGGEYHSACPICRAGADRFHCWPERPSTGQCDIPGVWGCRVCDKSGDFISLLMAAENLGFKEACKQLGQKIRSDGYAPARLPKSQEQKERLEIAPDAPLPPALWREKNTALADYAHELLLQTPEQLAWLAARGLDETAVCRHRLGWLPGEISKTAAARGQSPKLWYTRPLAAWGLPVDPGQKNRQGKPKTVFSFPAGLTIPRHQPVDGREQVVSLRIRRPEAHHAPDSLPARKYMVFKGAPVLPLFIPPRSPAMPYAVLVTESELDAMLVAEIALRHGLNCGSLALCSNTARPHPAAHKALVAAARVLLCLDFDPAGSGGKAYTDKALAKWLNTYARARDWPPPAGKDPGEAYALGVNLPLWLAAGLPESCLPASRKAVGPKPTTAAPAGNQDRTTPVNAPANTPASTSAATPGMRAQTAVITWPNDLAFLHDVWRDILPHMILTRVKDGFAISFAPQPDGENPNQPAAPPDWPSAESMLAFMLATSALRRHLDNHPKKYITAQNFLYRSEK